MPRMLGRPKYTGGQDDWTKRLEDPEFVKFLDDFNYSKEYDFLVSRKAINQYRDYKSWNERIENDPDFVEFLKENGFPLEFNVNTNFAEVTDLYSKAREWNQRVATNKDFAEFLSVANYSTKFNKNNYHEIKSRYLQYLSWKEFKQNNPEYISEALDGTLSFEEYAKSPEIFENSLQGWKWLKQTYPKMVEFAEKNDIPHPKTTKLYENRTLRKEVRDFMTIMDLVMKSPSPREAYAHYTEEYVEFSIAQNIGLNISFAKYCTLKDMHENMYLQSLIGDAYLQNSSQADLDEAFSTLRKVQSSIASGIDKEEKKSLIKRFFGKEKGKNAALNYAISRHKTIYSLEDLSKEGNSRDAQNIIGCYNATAKVLKDQALQRKCGINLKPSEINFDSIFDYFWKEASWYKGNVYDTESFLLLPYDIRMGVINGIGKKAQVNITRSAIDFANEIIGGRR